MTRLLTLGLALTVLHSPAQTDRLRLEGVTAEHIEVVEDAVQKGRQYLFAKVIDLPYAIRHLRISPDGKMLAYCCTPDGARYPRECHVEILHLRNRKIESITPEWWLPRGWLRRRFGRRDMWPSWSADSNTLIFSSHRGAAGRARLAAYDVERARRRTVLKDRTLSALSPALSPDGRAIVFSWVAWDRWGRPPGHFEDWDVVLRILWLDEQRPAYTEAGGDREEGGERSVVS